MRRPASEPPALGPEVLRWFRDEAGIDDLRDLLAAFGPDDRASARLLAAVGAELDLQVPRHRAALLSWLRSWGCRHLRVADSPRSSAALRRWWVRWSDALPTPRRSLVDLDARDVDRIAPAYAALASLRAATRASALGDVAVTFGDTAAAKALFAIRPRAFPPWDEPIRLAFGATRNDGALFGRYLVATSDALRGSAARLGVPVVELPRLLGRPSSTPARLVDEVLWLRVTRDGRVAR